MSITISLRALQAFYADVLQALGGNAEEAAAFAEYYAVADLRGMDWQGLKALHKHIVEPARKGIIALDVQSEVVSERDAATVIDARGQVGQLACSRAMEGAVATATRLGVGATVIRRCGDSGLIGGYTERAAAAGCIGIVFNNTNPYVAPWGGTERVFGLDPLSVAIPTGGDHPILLDTSVVDARAFDEPERYEPPYPPPAVAFFGSVREYGLAVVLESLCAGLAQIEVGSRKVRRGECGVVVLALHVEHFVEAERFTAAVDELVRNIKESRPAPGVAELLLPGERGYREHDRRRVEGIPVQDATWERALAIASDLGVTAPEAT